MCLNARAESRREKNEKVLLSLCLSDALPPFLSQCKWSGTSVFVATATATLSLMVVAETLEL